MSRYGKPLERERQTEHQASENLILLGDAAENNTVPEAEQME